MKLYARRGVADWNNAPSASKQVAQFALSNRIAEHEWQAFRTIDANLKGGSDERCMYIPMPMINHRDILHCFFSPIKLEGEMAFDLVLIVGDDQSLGFRFEPADKTEDSSHGYGHVQFNHLMQKSIEVKGIPKWLPDSYPAFPMTSSEPLQMFLLMATSVHGYPNGMVTVLDRVFHDKPLQKAAYLQVLEVTVL